MSRAITMTVGRQQREVVDAGLTVAELKEQLKALDQPVSGTKAELEQRLAEAAVTPTGEAA